MGEILRARRAPADNGAAELEVRMKYASAVAAAKQALPPAYVNNPGAVLLAQEWAQSHGVDLLTTLQTVSFIHGRPTVDATMQRALAQRAGYSVKPTDIGDKSATVQVRKGDEVVGEATYTLKDAELAKLLTKDNWEQNPKAMLVARATTQAIRWYAPEVMVGVWTEDEIDDPVDVLSDAPIKLPKEEPEEVEDAEVVPTMADLKAAIEGLSLEHKDALAKFGDAQGWPEKRSEMTAEQIEAAFEWIGRRDG